MQKNVFMKRNILGELLEWKRSDKRKPLILNGARQVGKTYILQEFGKKYYKNVAYVNCDRNDILRQIFAPIMIFHGLSAHCRLFWMFI